MSHMDISAIDLKKIETFLYDEATLLDKADLDTWITLYADDGSYWMPATPDQESPDTHISLMYDDRLLMEIRRRNFGHHLAASMEHDVRASHIISNIRVTEASETELTVTSNFQAVLFYREKQTLFAGRYTHVLIPNDECFLIRSKRVDLINCDAPLESIVIYL